ncbi:6955_t:CDS:2 [Ambispora gerdemannii]|uniref:6955_t:CDS:1 n=1 Tax=Ambispora gerdemannii TaxID=144530 RepID=A0A9N9BYL4_9GLOM|nr:6955_t:CDS:2 [Ambispora gerdemannii]
MKSIVGDMSSVKLSVEWNKLSVNWAFEQPVQVEEKEKYNSVYGVSGAD